MDASNDAQMAHRKITRQRASLSCQVCRRRKIKCDKVRPVCGTCLKNGNFCTYGSMSSPVHPSSDSGFSNPYLGNPGMTVADEAGPKRRRGLESHDVASASFADCGSTGMSKAGSASAPLSMRECSADLETKLDRLTSMVELALKKNPRNSKGSRKKTEKSNLHNGSAKRTHPSEVPHPTSIHSLETSDKEDDSVSSGSDSTSEMQTIGDPTMGHLSITDGGRSRYIGGTYWASVADEIAELSRLLRQGAIFQPMNVDLRPRIHRLDHSSEAEAVLPDAETENKQSSIPLINHSDLDPDLIDKSILLRTMDIPEPAHFAVLHEGLLEDLPSRNQCNLLYRCYVSGVHSSAPLVHLPTLLHWYEDFWSWYEHRPTTKIPFPHPSFIPLLYAILYGGAVSCSAKILSNEIGDKRSLTSRLHSRVTQSLSMLSFVESPSIPGLIAFCIVQTISLKEEEPLRARIFVNVAVQTAVSMGLHREPSKFGICSGDAETRRRLWWHILWIDILASNCTGWPLLVMADSYWDVEIVSELRDSLIGTKAGEKYLEAVRNGSRKPDTPDDPFQDLKSHVSLPLVVAQGRFVAAGYLRKIVRIQLGVKPIGNKEFQSLRQLLFDVQHELEARIARIPNLESFTSVDSKTSDSKVGGSPRTPIKHYKGMIPEVNIHSHINYHKSTWAAYHKWAKCQLELMMHKTHCVVSQTCIKNVGLWGELREGILGHCHAYMRGYFAVNVDPDFQPFTWGWPGYQQPLHAMMLMLIDLYRKPFSPEATQSRFYVDQCFLLLEPDGGPLLPEDGPPVQRPMCEGGKQAWTFLRQLRCRTWRVAGLDPDVLWTKNPGTYQDGIRYGAEKDHTSTPNSQKPSAALEVDRNSTVAETNCKQAQWKHDGANLSTTNVTDFRQSNDVNPRPSEDVYALPNNTSTSTTAAGDLTLSSALEHYDGPQDFDWSEWDSIFGQYAPLDDEAVDMENTNLWQL